MIDNDSQTKVEEKAALSEYDKKVLEIKNSLDPAELVTNGFLSLVLDVRPGILAGKFKSLSGEQVRVINKEVAKFANPKYETYDNPVTGKRERMIVVDPPTKQEIDDYATYLMLAQALLEVNGESLGDDPRERYQKLHKLDSTLVTALYRKLLQFLTAVRLLFPDEDQEKQLEALKN